MEQKSVGLYTRRDFGKLALATLPAASLFARPGAALALQAKPNSVWGGVPFGIFAPYRFRCRSGWGPKVRAARPNARSRDRKGLP